MFFERKSSLMQGMSKKLEKQSSKIAKDDFDSHLERVGQYKDRKSFILIFEYFAPRVKSFLMNNKIDASLAEEITQDVFLTLWRKAQQYDSSKAAASTWIFTIARNRRIDFIRKHSRVSYQEDEQLLSYLDEEDESADAVDFVEQKQQRLLLKEAFKELPKEQSLLIKKSFFENKSHSEIAKEIQLPLGTVKSRIRLAMNKLRGLINDEIL